MAPMKKDSCAIKSEPRKKPFLNIFIFGRKVKYINFNTFKILKLISTVNLVLSLE